MRSRIPPSAARVGLPRDDDARDRETTRGARSRSECPAKAFRRAEMQTRGEAREVTSSRARAAPGSARARRPRVRVTRRVERHRVSVRDDSSQPRERNDAAPSPRANRSTRDAARSSLDSRAQGCERSRGRSTRNARARRRKTPGGGSRCVTPETDGRKPTPSGRSPIAGSALSRLGRRASRRPSPVQLAESSRGALVDATPRAERRRAVPPAGEPARVIPSPRTGTPRDGPGLLAFAESTSVDLYGAQSESARPIRSADLPIPGNLPRVEILIFSRTLAGRCPRVAWHHGRVRRHGYTPTRARTPST